MIFVPHQPYVPSGSMRTAIAYPRHVDEFDDAAARAALARCGLVDYVDKLDIEARWDQTLSESEQQRLAFVRLVLRRPECVVMAEATSELDDAAESDLMSIFANELKRGNAAHYCAALQPGQVHADAGACEGSCPSRQPVPSPRTLSPPAHCRGGRSRRFGGTSSSRGHESDERRAGPVNRSWPGRGAGGPGLVFPRNRPI